MSSKTQEATPVMSHRGLRPEARDTRRKDGMTREEFAVVIDERDGRQLAARLTPEPGGWCCIAVVDGKRRDGHGLTVDSAFHDVTRGVYRQTRGRWTATISDLDGDEHVGSDSRPGQALRVAYVEFIKALSARHGGVR